jgi:hypothetical protein
VLLHEFLRTRTSILTSPAKGFGTSLPFIECFGSDRALLEPYADILREVQSGQHAPLECQLPRHPNGLLHRPPVMSDAMAVAIVMPALGPSFGMGPVGTCT